MPTNKNPIPEQFSLLEEIRAFWYTHSTADYWDEKEDIEIELSPSLRARLEIKKLQTWQVKPKPARSKSTRLVG